MRNLKQILITMLLFLVGDLTAYADGFEANNSENVTINYTILSEAELTCEVAGLSREISGHVTVPKSVTYDNKNYKVTSIGKEAFWWHENIESVSLPETLIEIKELAFASCTALKSIEIPGSVEYIDYEAFQNCKSMTEVVFNAKNCVFTGSKWSYEKCVFNYCSTVKFEKAVVIPRNIFSNSTSLQNIVFGEKVNEIDKYAFERCENLQSVTIPSNVKIIGESAFQYCNNLKTLVIEDGVETIGRWAFQHCTSLDNIAFPASINMFGTLSFFECSSLENFTLANPNNYEFFSAHVFLSTKWWNMLQQGRCHYLNNGEILYLYRNSYSPLPSVEIADGTRIIAGRAFSGGNSKVTKIVIPNSVEYIGNGAFGYFDNLEKITIGSGLKKIDGDLISCSSTNNLKEIRIHALTPPECLIGNVGYENDWAFEKVDKDNCTLYVESSALDAYKNAPYWSTFKNIKAIDMIDIDDKSEYLNDEEQFCKIINYTRNFTSTNWQPLYIPFSMSYEEWSEYADVAEIRGIYAYDDSEGTEHTVLAFHKLTGGELKANTPYVIKPKEAGKVTFSCSNKTLKAAENGSVWCASTRKKYTLTGVYEEKADMSGVYAMSGGAFYMGDSNSPALCPFRFYLTVEDIDNGYGSGNAANAARCIQIAVDDEVTGIDEVMALSEGNDGCYDLSGRKVMLPAKGICIHNGKKMFVK